MIFISKIKIVLVLVINIYKIYYYFFTLINFKTYLLQADRH